MRKEGIEPSPSWSLPRLLDLRATSARLAGLESNQDLLDRADANQVLSRELPAKSYRRSGSELTYRCTSLLGLGQIPMAVSWPEY